jgi:hypothetical protein
MSFVGHVQTIAIELDEQTWSEQLDRVEQWLGNVLLAQATFRMLLEDTVGKIHEPHIQEYLREMLQTAEKHERRAEELYALIGRNPAPGRKLVAAVMNKARQALGDVLDLAGGMAGGARDIRQLLLANLEAIGAFGLAEQLGLALAIEQLADAAWEVVNEKTRDQLLLQEYLLEMGPAAILYKLHA